MQINTQLNPALYEQNLTMFGNAKNNNHSFPSSANALTSTPSCQNISTPPIEFENESLLPNHEDSSNNENQNPNTKTDPSQNNTIFLEDYITNEPVDFNSKKIVLKFLFL